MKFLTKKIIGSLFIFSVVILLIAILFQETCNLQNPESLCKRLWSETADVGRIAFFFSVLLLPVLFTLPFKKSIFNSWKRFAVWGVPISTLFFVWIGVSGSSGSLPGQFHAGVIFYPLILAIYYAISFTIVVSVWYTAKENKKLSWWLKALMAITFAILLFFVIGYTAVWFMNR